MRWLRWMVTMVLLAGLYAACGGGGGSSTTGPTVAGGTPPPANPPAPTTDGGGGGDAGGGGGGGGGGASLSRVGFRSVQIVVTPSGGGTVSDNFAGSGSVVQGCTTCTERYRVGTRVLLSAEPSPSFSFDHWQGGACDASPLPTCSLTVAGDARITAVFR